MAKLRLFTGTIKEKGIRVQVEAKSLNDAREMNPGIHNWEELENFGNIDKLRAYICPRCKHITRAPNTRLMINCKGCGRSMEANVTNEVFD